MKPIQVYVSILLGESLLNLQFLKKNVIMQVNYHAAMKPPFNYNLYIKMYVSLVTNQPFSHQFKSKWVKTINCQSQWLWEM
jgi:hypothetical protein